MNMTEFAKEVHENAVAHGWWDEPRSFGEVIALCHSELSEAMEEYRNGRPMEYVDDAETCERITDPAQFNGRKPEGIAVEMADCIIRILDCAAKMGWDCSDVKQLSFTIVGIWNLPECISELHAELSDAWFINKINKDGSINMFRCARKIIYWLKHNYGTNWMELVRRKHEYNKTRPYRHGGKRL